MKLRTRAVLAIAVFLLLGAVVFLYNQKTRRHSEPLSLRLQWIHQAQFAGFYVANEKGFYRENGIDLGIEPGGKDFNVPLLVAEGRADFGIWVGDQVLVAFDKRKMPIRAIGTVFNRSLACFMVREDSGIFKPTDFAGKTIGIYPGFDTESIYLELLRRFRLDRNTIKEYPAAYSIVPFLRREVDIWPSYVINEPLAARENNVPVTCLGPENFGIQYYSDTLIVKDSLLRDNRDLVLRFVEASERGWRYALSHPDEAVEIVLKNDPSLKREHETAMLRALAPYINPTDPMFKMDSAVWKSMAEILKSRGAIDDVTSAERVGDFQIAEEAHQKHRD